LNRQLLQALARHLCLLALAASALQGVSQNRSFTKNTEFVRYLTENKEFTDAEAALSGINERFLNATERDSLNFLKGKVYYKDRRFDSSCVYLRRVLPGSPNFTEAGYYSMLDRALLYQPETANCYLDSMQADSDRTHAQLRSFEKASLALLMRDFKTFEQIAPGFSYDYFQVADEQHSLVQLHDALKKEKKKYPAVAGILSGLIPGAGKIYAGQPGQGIAAFVMVGIFAGATAEVYKHSGRRDTEFILMASVFSIFYTGNILGSIYGVKTHKIRHADEVNKVILYNMRIPMGRVFGGM